MTSVKGFKPIATDNAKVLILGSMPGEISLKMNQYYAHPRNGFWFILGELLGFDPNSSYELRVHQLKKNRISIWDVLKACNRSGSLDSAIKPASLVVNDFELFFSKNSDIKYVFFNGAKAEALYKKHVLPDMLSDFDDVSYYRLPSTSPAYAAMRLHEKLIKWNIVSEKLR